MCHMLGPPPKRPVPNPTPPPFSKAFQKRSKLHGVDDLGYTGLTKMSRQRLTLRLASARHAKHQVRTESSSCSPSLSSASCTQKIGNSTPQISIHHARSFLSSQRSNHTIPKPARERSLLCLRKALISPHRLGYPKGQKFPRRGSAGQRSSVARSRCSRVSCPLGVVRGGNRFASRYTRCIMA